MTPSKTLPFICAIVVVLSISLSVQATRPTSEFLLWTGSAPGAIGSDPEDMPTLTPYYAASSNETGAAMIVCPGGGYSFLSSLYEGEYFALWLNEQGISAFVLKYRLGPDGYQHPSMMLDAQRAMRYVRANSSDWNLDPNRLGIMGASAGGHLAATTMVHFDTGNPGSLDPVEQVSCRPDLGVLCYPVITMSDPYVHAGSKLNLLGENPDSALVEYLSAELQVTTNTPPAFLMHTETDPKVPYQNSTMFADAMASNSVPHELHLYPTGGHGVGLGSTPGDAGNYHPWTDECRHWLFQAGFGLPDLGNIWTLGDSITDGASVPAWVPGGFRDSLYTNLMARGYTFRFVGSRNYNASTRLTNAGQEWHDGHSAFMIADGTIASSPPRNYSGLYDEVTGWSNSMVNKPDVILLLIGINDLNQKYDVAGAPARLDLLITRLFSDNPDIRILISSVLDADQNNPYRHVPPNTDLNGPITDYNAAIASIVAARQALGQNIVFVDMYAGLTLEDLSDQLHPNAPGYVKMANSWADAIESPPAFTTNAIEVADGMVTLTANGTIGTDYSVWGSTDLTATGWSLLTNDHVRVNPFTLKDVPASSQQFYRFNAP